MSSFVYFKFKSEKEPTRVPIDGPHTDVWNLKREIINVKRLGDGTDFDLKIYKENSNEEYTDDTEIVPKDSTVLARRLPAAAPGKGRAARYVSGKPPATAKTAATDAGNKINAAMQSALSEEEKLKVMMKMTDAQWRQTQEEMSHDARINVPGQKGVAKKANIPEGEPPHGYVCFRCGQKGHWIQACPTNEDAAYDNRARIKKTTGIPRSMLQKVDKSDIDNLDEQQRQNVMITSEGEYVLAQADKKTWQKFQDQKNATDAAQRNVHSGSAELQTLGLECPIDRRLFVDPMKTPCCGKTYCHECIENALLDGDLRCPNCQTENVSLEGLQADEEVIEKIKEYNAKTRGSSPGNAVADAVPAADEEASSPPAHRPGSQSPRSPSSVAGRKRTASEATESKDQLNVPATAMKRQKSSTGSDASTPTIGNAQLASANPGGSSDMPNQQDFNAMMQQMSQAANMTNMGMPANMPMMNPMMMNPMMMSMMTNMNGNMNGMPAFNNMNNAFMNSNQPWTGRNQGWNGQQGQAGQGHWNPTNNRGGYRGNRKANNFQKTQQAGPPQGLENVPKGPKAMNAPGPPSAPTGPAASKFSNQQRHQNEEDNAYIRQPVNPARAMNRDRGRRGMRNAEYKEVGQ